MLMHLIFLVEFKFENQAGERGHLTANYTGTQTFRNTLSNWLALKRLVTLINIDWLVQEF